MGSRKTTPQRELVLQSLLHPYLFFSYSFYGDSIFLIDHAWTFQPSNAHQQLLHIPGLANRMAALMGLGGASLDVLLGGGGRGKESDGEDSYEADSESGMKKMTLYMYIMSKT